MNLLFLRVILLAILKLFFPKVVPTISPVERGWVAAIRLLCSKY